MALTVLDAGVVIALLDARDAHHAAAVTALKQARARDDTLVLPVSAYAEVLVEPMTRGRAAARRVDDALKRLSVRVESATREIAVLAAQLRAQHGRRLRLPDALVVATAQAVAAERLVTTDAAFRGVRRGVVVIG